MAVPSSTVPEPGIHTFAVNARARFFPDWQTWSFLFLAPDTALAGAVAAELRFRAARRTTARRASAVPAPPRQTVCRSVASTKDAMAEISSGRVLAIVLDLQQLPRESLGLLRQLLRDPARPPIVAIGTESHRELTGLLLESGCSALHITPPLDLPLADWCQRVLSSR